MKKVVEYESPDISPWKLYFMRLYNSFIRVSQERRALIYRQVAQMIIVGIPLTRAIDAVINQERSKAVRTILRDIYIKVVSGVSFSAACSYHPEMFPPVYIPLLRTGEVSGNLDIILMDVANHAEEQLRVQRNIINNLTYPAIAIITAAIILTIIFFFCFPGFIEIFHQFNMKLPLITRMAIATYEISTNPFIVIPFFMGIFILISLWFRALAKIKPLRIKVDEIKLYLPIIGELYRKISLATFCRAFVLLYKSGIAFVEIFRILPSTMDNTYMMLHMKGVVDSLIEGKTLGEAFEAIPFIPPLLSQSMTVAEETGNLEVLIPKVAEYFERDAEYTTERILQLMEPIAVVVISTVVFIIILAVFLPLLQIISAFGSM